MRTSTDMRLADLVTWLRRLADAGRPIPSLPGIADGTGIRDEARVTQLLREGERRGILVVEYGTNGIAAIGAADGSWHAVRREERIALPPRRCLTCRREFQPSHRHNFLCGCASDDLRTGWKKRQMAASGDPRASGTTGAAR